MDLPSVGLGAGFLGHKPHGLRHPLAATDNQSVGGSLHDVDVSTGMPIVRESDVSKGPEKGTTKGPSKGPQKGMPAVVQRKHRGRRKG